MTKKTATAHTIDIHIDFWESVVTDVHRKQCEEAFRKFVENPTSHGLHVERLTNIPGAPLYSLRINQGMRIIFQIKNRQDNNEIKTKTIQILELTNHYEDSRYIRNRCNPYAAESQFVPFEPTAEAVNPIDIQLIPPRLQPPIRTNHKKRKGKQPTHQQLSKPILQFVFHPTTLYQDFITLSPQQTDIINKICQNPFLAHIVMGPPGAGKSAIALEIIRAYLTKYTPEHQEPGHAIYIAPTEELTTSIRNIFNDTPCEPPLRVSFLTYKRFLKQYVPSLENKQCVGFDHFKAWWDNYLKPPRKKKLPTLFYTMPQEDIYKAFKVISGHTKEDFLSMGEAYLPFSEENDNGLLFDACDAYLAYLNRREIYDVFLFTPPSPIEHGARLLIMDEVQATSSAQIATLIASMGNVNTAEGKRFISFGDPHQSYAGEIPIEQILRHHIFHILGVKLQHHALPTSFRCSEDIIEMINGCIKAKSIICGGLGSKEQYTQTQSAAPKLTEEPSTIHWLGIDFFYEKHQRRCTVLTLANPQSYETEILHTLIPGAGAYILDTKKTLYYYLKSTKSWTIMAQPLEAHLLTLFPEAVEKTTSYSANAFDTFIQKIGLPPHQQHLLNLAESPRFAVITEESYVEEASQIFNTPLVFTKKNIAGLEYPLILLYMPTNNKALVEVSQILKQKLAEGQTPALHRPKDYETFREYQKYIGSINEIILYLSRNVSPGHLYILADLVPVRAFFDFIINAQTITPNTLPSLDLKPTITHDDLLIKHDLWAQEKKRLEQMQSPEHEAIIATIDKKLQDNTIIRSEKLTFPTQVTPKTLKAFFDNCQTLDMNTLIHHLFTPTRNYLALSCFNGSNQGSLTTYLNTVATIADVTSLSTLFIKSFFISKKNKVIATPIIRIVYEYLNNNWDIVDKIKNISPFFEDITGQNISIFEALLSDDNGQMLLLLFVIHHSTFLEAIRTNILFSKAHKENSTLYLKKSIYTSKLGLHLLHYFSSSPDFINALIAEIMEKGPLFTFLTQNTNGLSFLSHLLQNAPPIYDLFKSDLFKIDTSLLKMQKDGVETLESSEFLLFKVIAANHCPVIKIEVRYADLMHQLAFREKISCGRTTFIIGDNNEFCYFITGNYYYESIRRPDFPADIKSLKPFLYGVYSVPSPQRAVIPKSLMTKSLSFLLNKPEPETVIHELLTQAFIYNNKRIHLLEFLVSHGETAIIKELLTKNPEFSREFSTRDFIIDHPKEPLRLLSDFPLLNEVMAQNNNLFREPSFISVVTNPRFENHVKKLLGTNEGPFDLIQFFQLLGVRNSALQTYIDDISTPTLKGNKVNTDEEKMIACIKGDLYTYFSLEYESLLAHYFVEERMIAFLKNKAILYFLNTNPIIAQKTFRRFLGEGESTRAFYNALYQLSKNCSPLLCESLALAFFCNKNNNALVEKPAIEHEPIEPNHKRSSIALSILNDKALKNSHSRFINLLLNIVGLPQYICVHELFKVYGSQSDERLIYRLRDDENPTIVNKRMLILFQIPNFFEISRQYDIPELTKWVDACIIWCEQNEIPYPEYFIDFSNEKYREPDELLCANDQAEAARFNRFNSI